MTEVGALSAAGWAWLTHAMLSASLLPAASSVQAGLAAPVGATLTAATGWIAVVIINGDGGCG